MKKRNFVLRGLSRFNSAERICGNLNPSPLAGEGSGVRGNKAFTLAEVLITLVIAGVIGALTVPSLIQNTQKQEYVAALKKAYSTLSQVTQQIIAEEGSPKQDESGYTWLNNVDDMYNMYKKYLNSAKECREKNGCFEAMEQYGHLRKLVSADGIQFAFDASRLSKDCSRSDDIGENYCAYIWADVNGSKKPNKSGIDNFVFLLQEDRLVPGGCGMNVSCPNAKCACKVLTEGAMNY